MLNNNEKKTNTYLFDLIVKRYSVHSIIVVYNLMVIFTGALFYNLLPILMHPPEAQIVLLRTGGMAYPIQIIVMLSMAMIIGSFFLIRVMKGISNWQEKTNGDTILDKEQISRIRKKCINLPYVNYFIQLLVFPLSISIIFSVLTIIAGNSLLNVVKIVVLVMAFLTVVSVFTHIFSVIVFSKILFKMNRVDELEGIRLNLMMKIFLQILPILITAILFTSLIGYSRFISEKGDLIHRITSSQLKEMVNNSDNTYNEKKLGNILEGIKDPEIVGWFVVSPDKKIVTSDGKPLSKVLYQYLDDDLFKKFDGHVFSELTEVQGSAMKINTENGTWIAGLVFSIPSSTMLFFILYGLISIIVLSIIALYFFSRTLSREISLVAESLMDIASGDKVDLDRKIAVTTNDEIADLVIAFNKIQEREKQHIKDVEEQHSIIAEQERLATLGHLIGGIAHNMRTPIMSIAGATEGLQDLIDEYIKSIDDEKVEKKDHHEIAKDMITWLNKIRPHCDYMSDILNAIKDQTVQTDSKTWFNFNIGEVCSRIKLLTEHELRKRNCKLRMDINIPDDQSIPGDISILIQAINNLLLNACDAYNHKEGQIELIVNVMGNKVVFAVKDNAGGIPNEIQEKLFKEMVTSKGREGTGLGLYMTYANIKGRFGGSMWFETEEGQGTIFYISIPQKKSEGKAGKA